MNKKTLSVLLVALLALSALLSACAGSSGGGSDGAPSGNQDEETGDKPFPLTLVVNQVGEIPAAGNEVEQRIMEYTNTELKIQWVPASTYDEKINVMIASDELPHLIKLNYTPTIVSSLKSDLFWEIGPYLNDYKNLAAQNEQFYNNISVGGKIYGVPLFRDLGRAALHYRKDWFDDMGLETPKTLDDWYEVIKAIVLGDPDKNGKDDTYGFMLDKYYNKGTASMLTRLSVAQGGPNKWAYEDGEFIPEFMTDTFFDTMKLFRRMYEEKLINQDFAVVDSTEVDKVFESGRSAMRISGGNAQSMQDKVEKVVPTAVVDVVALAGPDGRRLPGESGNAGFLAIPKSTVKTEEEMRRVLQFVDQMMDPEMATLLVKGIEGRHWEDAGDYTKPLDKDANAKEIKPYRDTLPHRGESYNIDKPSLDPELAMKNSQIGKENEQYIVPNPVLNLDSEVYTERGQELEQMITDAQTKFIMGVIDEAGWLAEVERWKQAGGEKMRQEYKESYEASTK